MTAWHGGKGSGSRPRQVSNEDYANRWDAIFQKDVSQEEPEEKPLKDYNGNLHQVCECEKCGSIKRRCAVSMWSAQLGAGQVNGALMEKK